MAKKNVAKTTANPKLGASFASDNAAGMAPEILQALMDANAGYAPSYGADSVTSRAAELFRAEFGPRIDVQFVMTGTAANVTAMATLVRPFEAVICAETAHAQLDECGAPERFIGCKLITVPSKDGKISPAEVEARLKGFGVAHHSQARLVTISQPTELGTVYSLEETRALADLAHDYGLLLHIDGARITNAAAALGVSLRELTRDCGVDALSFGGTKAGLLAAEAVIFFEPARSASFPFHRKQAMQLASKMRFVSAQLEALLTETLWLRLATHANAMAALLEERVREIPGVEISRPVQTNAVFARLPRAAISEIQAKHAFHVWGDAATERPEVRWMTSFAHTLADIESFVAAVSNAVAKHLG